MKLIVGFNGFNGSTVQRFNGSTVQRFNNILVKLKFILTDNIVV